MTKMFVSTVTGDLVRFGAHSTSRFIKSIGILVAVLVWAPSAFAQAQSVTQSILPLVPSGDATLSIGGASAPDGPGDPGLPGAGGCGSLCASGPTVNAVRLTQIPAAHIPSPPDLPVVSSNPGFYGF
jgi:hypothetical protein